MNDVEGFEAFLHQYRNVLHPNHYLCLSAKYALSQLYGKVDSYLIHEMSLTQLQRKRDICRDILKVFDLLEPGYSRLRGIIVLWPEDGSYHLKLNRNIFQVSLCMNFMHL